MAGRQNRNANAGAGAIAGQDHRDLVAALQEHLSGMIGASSGLIESLPESVKRRVNALKNLQKQRVAFEAEIQKEIQELEKKLNAQSLAIFQKRAEIVSGTYEPTDAEAHFCDGDEEHEHEEAPSTDAKDAADGIKGIPAFWIGAIQNCPQLSMLVEEHDLPILEHLTDIKLDYLVDDMGYRLDFHFSENPFFTNKVLSKTYYLSIEPDPSDLIFEGPVYDHAEGTVIEWKEGKNVTEKQEKKKQRKKGGAGAGKVRTVVKTVKQESFFHFFNAPEPIGDDEEDEEKIAMMEDMLSQDFEIGEVFREKVIPMAVLYFTGESAMFDDEDDYDEDDEDDDEDDYESGNIREIKDGDDDDDDDDDDVQAPAGGDKPSGEKPPECKQS